MILPEKCICKKSGRSHACGWEIPSRCTAVSSAKHHIALHLLRRSRLVATGWGELFCMQISNHVIVSAQPSESEISISLFSYLRMSWKRAPAIGRAVLWWWFPLTDFLWQSHIPQKSLVVAVVVIAGRSRFGLNRVQQLNMIITFFDEWEIASAEGAEINNFA